MILQHKFVEYIPQDIEDGVLYISMEYRTAIHKCICGCGNKVVTPLLPNGWTLTYSGEGITLSPSIGNWNFSCQSHYWIRNDQVILAPKWDKNSGVPKSKNRSKNFFSRKKGK